MRSDKTGGVVVEPGFCVQAPCAMRSDKTDASFKAVIYLASAVIQSR